VTCPDCYGTGQLGGRDLTTVCEMCNGEGEVDGDWADDDARDPLAVAANMRGFWRGGLSG